MYDMARLAFETDSTRFIALLLDSVNSPAITVDGQPTDDGYHNLSHHGKNAKKLAQLEMIDREHMKLLSQLFTDLKSRSEGNETLLDRSMILYGSNLGDADTHVTDNLPVLFAGGGFRHGQHLAFDREGATTRSRTCSNPCFNASASSRVSSRHRPALCEVWKFARNRSPPPVSVRFEVS